MAWGLAALLGLSGCAGAQAPTAAEQQAGEAPRVVLAAPASDSPAPAPAAPAAPETLPPPVVPAPAPLVVPPSTLTPFVSACNAAQQQPSS